MSVVMMAPVGMVMARGAMAANNARAIHGPYQAAARWGDKAGTGGRIIVIGIIIRVVIVIGAANEHPAEAMPASKTVSGKSVSPRNDGRSSADRAAMNGRTTKTAAAAKPTAKTATTAAAVSAVNFNREPIGGSLAGGGTSRIDRRQRFGALAGDSR